MAERALALSGALVRAYQPGLKDITRRGMRAIGPPTIYAAVPEYMRVHESARRPHGWLLPDMGGQFECPMGKPGDTFWIREPARVVEVARRVKGRIMLGPLSGARVVRLRYEADGVESDWVDYPERLRPPVAGKGIPNGVHREGARLFADLVSVGAEPVNAITEEDALREGMELCFHGPYGFTWKEQPAAVANFRRTWMEIYGEESWANDWCWRLELRRLEKTMTQKETERHHG